MRTVFEPSFIAVGCNVVSSCLAWGARFAAFGAGNAVALLSPEKNAVVATFSGAGAPIHKVRWLDETTLFAVCNKGLLVIELDPARRLDEAAVTFKTVVAGEGQQFHGLSVVANARGKGEALVVIAGTHVVSFQYSAASRACTQDEEGIAALAARQLSECTAAALLPRFKVAIVAVGGADRRVHLYVDDGRKGLCYVAWLEGHQDWVRDLAFCSEPDTGDLLLASCSSDHFVRLWRVARFAGGKTAGEQGAGQESEDRQKIVFAVNDHKGNAPQFAASLDALLVGHSHFVHSVAWSSEGKNLISASMDKTMIVWEKDAEDQVWVDRFRVGEIGGNLLGFFGAAFSPDGGHVLGHSYNGSLHLWAKKANAPGFEPRATVSGHLKHVTDVSWDPKGRYLVSASHDQTARLWAPWIENGVSRGWFELARPQVHGHDINAISMLAGSYEHVLVSGADEKTVRVFGGTGSFVASLQNVSGAETAASERNRPFGATLPPLGLSNKPLNTINDAAAADEARLNEAFPDEVWRAQPVVLTSPPVETQLSQSTLWVEDQKVRLWSHCCRV
jgi:elongator complex protein 2